MPHARPVSLICAILRADPQLDDAVDTRLEAAFGSIVMRSPCQPFADTAYYEPEMGTGLGRRLVVFGAPFDPGALAAAKRTTIAIEDAFRRPAGGGRRVNRDPGYLTPAKLVLATTKDFSHRVYLADGIYAEVTLQFGRGGAVAQPWTYPDFRSGRYDAFLLAARQRRMELDRALQPGTGGGARPNTRT